ncbi:hypothetical protein BSL78_17477 [Apostichopus japonicus]|uniref:dCTP pyrophosphatase 1 n=1 Tax=Stichopus japonicus TaxID=307972 RepID=A0A2G8KCC6_STIJA|nr:hypothetical protein BSL78_17477 [Apostichopus japonicus]
MPQFTNHSFPSFFSFLVANFINVASINQKRIIITPQTKGILASFVTQLGRMLQNQFAKERDWDQFHQPRNLLLAMLYISDNVGYLNILASPLPPPTPHPFKQSWFLLDGAVDPWSEVTHTVRCQKVSTSLRIKQVNMLSPCYLINELKINKIFHTACVWSGGEGWLEGRTLLVILIMIKETFQWKGEVKEGLPDWSEKDKKHLEQELSDVLIYLVRLSEKCHIDLPKAAIEKIALNGKKYPAEKVQGSSKKYTEYI